MKKRILMMGFIVLLCMNQFVNVLPVYAAQIERNREVRELFHNEKIYSVDASDETWKELKTEKRRFEKTQIKPELVNKMDTETLLEAVIDSPMIYTIENSVDRKEGVEEFIDHLNAGKELLERKDSKDKIIKEYLSLQVPKKVWNDYSQIQEGKDLNRILRELLSDQEFSDNLEKDMDIYYRIHFLEGILLSDDIYPLLRTDEKRTLYHKSLELNEQKQFSEIFSYHPEESFTKALLRDNDLNKNTILTNRKKANKITPIKIYTKNGSVVYAEKRSDNHLNSSAFMTNYQKERPEVDVIGHGFSGNNCHAYSWPRRTDIWINDPDPYTKDGSFKKIKGKRPTANKQRVMHSNHSAFVVNYKTQQARIQTKRGGNPVYECDLDADFKGIDYSIYQEVNTTMVYK